MPLGRGEPDLALPAVHPLRREVEREVGGLEARVRISGRDPAQRSPEASEELVHPERLRHVVVGAGIERRDLRGLGVTGGEHHDRNRAPAAQALDHLDAVDAGQAEVEHDDIGMVPSREVERLFSGLGQVDVVATRPEVDAERPTDRRLVVDHEHAARLDQVLRGTERLVRHGHLRQPRSPPAPSLRSWTAGRLTTMVRPPPGVSSAVISPPIASTNPRATASPRPTPCTAASAIAEPLKGLEDLVTLIARHTRTAVDDTEVDAVADRSRFDPHRQRRRPPRRPRSRSGSRPPVRAAPDRRGHAAGSRARRRRPCPHARSGPDIARPTTSSSPTS